MNGKKAKQLRKKSKILLVKWLQSIVPDKKEAEKISGIARQKLGKELNEQH